MANILQWNWAGILFVILAASFLPVLEFWGWRQRRKRMRERLMHAIRYDRGPKW